MERGPGNVRRGAGSRRKRGVRLTQAFATDVQGQIASLKQKHGLEWVARLEEDLQSARELLTRFPLAGASRDEVGRRLPLRRLPVVAWYRMDEGGVLLLRLFHARQDRPRR